MGRPLKRARARGEPAAAAAVTAFVLLVCGAPMAMLLLGAARAPLAAPSLLGSAGPWVLLLRSLGLAASVTAGTLTLGVPMATVLARGRLSRSCRRALFALHALPMFLPPLLPALGWFHLLRGPGARAWLFSAGGVAFTLILTFTPVVTALVALALRSLSPALVESGRVVASARRVLWRLELPAVRPAAVLAGLLVFALTLSELAVPMFLRVDVYPAAVLTRLGGVVYAPQEAAALALPLLGVGLALLAVERRVAGPGARALLALRSDPSPPVDLPPPLVGFAGLLALASAAPVGALVLRSLDGGFEHLGMWLGDSPWNTLRGALAAATLMAMVALALGHALARARPWARRLDAVLLLTFFVPAAVLGVGLVATWHRPATRLVYGSLAIVVLGYLARYTVILVRTVAVAVARSSPAFEQAARVVGAGYGRRLLRVVLPMHARALVAAWLLGLVFCMRDVETAILYYPPGLEPLTVRIFTLEANGGDATVAALAVVQIALTLAALLAGAFALRGRTR